MDMVMARIKPLLNNSILADCSLDTVAGSYRASLEALNEKRCSPNINNRRVTAIKPPST